MTGVPFAEVIGDPVAHSKSPLIHHYWLRALGLAGDYRATSVSSVQLATFLRDRRSDPCWRGCNVTAPHKLSVIPLLDRVDPAASAMGAVNCIVRQGDTLCGYNSDVDGVAAALGGVAVADRRVVLIGAGGAARAAVHALLTMAPGEIVILARDAAAAAALAGAAPAVATARPMADAREAFAGASLIVNATPMGMAHADAMPLSLLAAMAHAMRGAAAFDMVYDPLRTPFLDAAADAGLRTIDGLHMLIGQARRGFELFFGAIPPPGDAELREALRTPGLPRSRRCG